MKWAIAAISMLAIGLGLFYIPIWTMHGEPTNAALALTIIGFFLIVISIIALSVIVVLYLRLIWIILYYLTLGAILFKIFFVKDGSVSISASVLAFAAYCGACLAAYGLFLLLKLIIKLIAPISGALSFIFLSAGTILGIIHGFYVKSDIHKDFCEGIVFYICVLLVGVGLFLLVVTIAGSESKRNNSYKPRKTAHCPYCRRESIELIYKPIGYHSLIDEDFPGEAVFQCYSCRRRFYEFQILWY